VLPYDQRLAAACVDNSLAVAARTAMIIAIIKGTDQCRLGEHRL